MNINTDEPTPEELALLRPGHEERILAGTLAKIHQGPAKLYPRPKERPRQPLIKGRPVSTDGEGAFLYAIPLIGIIIAIIIVILHLSGGLG